MSPPRRIAVVTGARSEYGLLRPILKRMLSTPGLEAHVIVAGMHLAHEFGDTWQEIERDGFRIHATIDMIFSRDTAPAMAKAVGVGIVGIAQAVESLRPDIVLVLGDRVEAFAGAAGAALSNVAVAHVHGGDRARGGLDDSMRHAITKMAHLHFAATDQSRERILRLGERPDRVYTVGAPGLDSLLTVATSPGGLAILERQLGFPLASPLVLAVQHPVSTDPDAAPAQMRETLEALKSLGHPCVLVYPNSDAGGRRMIEVIESYRPEPWLHAVPNLEHATYLLLLKHADVLVGNTSSGIIEAASFHLPVVNVGTRQDGRERSTHVIDVPHERAAIRAAIETALTDDAFRSRVRCCVNPYGDGHASERIVDVLRSVPITPDLLQKQITY